MTECLQKILSFLILIILFGCGAPESSKEPLSIGPFLRDGYSKMAFLSSCDSKLLSTEDVDLLHQELVDLGYKKEIKNDVLIANYSIPNSGLYYSNADASNTLFILEKSDQTELQASWKEIQSLIERHSGIQNGKRGKYYLKLEPDANASINTTFRINYHIVNIRNELSFRAEDIEELSDEEIKELEEANESLNSTLFILKKYLATPNDLIYQPLDGRILTSEERLYGFIDFWTEVKYNFAFFDQVPDLNWDQVLLDYLPQIKADQSNVDYYRLLEKICARLNDGHTNVYLPDELMMENSIPPLEFRSIEDKIYLTNFDTSFNSILTLGSQLISIEGVPVEKYLEENILPYVSSSTDYIKRSIAVSKILEGKRNTSVNVQLKIPEHEISSLQIIRDDAGSEWMVPSPRWELLTFKKIDDIAYLAINSFSYEAIVDEFTKHLAAIRESSKLIIDLRRNSGGNSNYGYQILDHLTKKDIVTSKWKTREHKAAYKAWGSYIPKTSSTLDEWELEAIATYKGDYWYESPPDTLRSKVANPISMPTAILIGNNTASAAEDFLIAAENISLGPTIGNFTFGSTGQPLELKLPGGGSARICTKKDLYPDGKEFVGYGIKPTFLVKKTIDDVLSNKDVVLDYALNYFRNLNQ